MKKIIALQGKIDSGKTKTFVKLRTDLLKNEYNFIETYKAEYLIDPEFCTVLEKNGKLIGILSAGDTDEIVYTYLKWLIDKKCTIIICPCRTRGGSVYAIKEFGQFQHEFVHKTIAYSKEDHQLSNEEDAETLFGKVEELICVPE